jgi:hypothetical protein
MHTHSTDKPKTFKQTSAYWKADGNCFLGHEWGADGGIHETGDHNNVYCETLKTNCVRPFRTKGVEC